MLFRTAPSLAEHCTDQCLVLSSTALRHNHFKLLFFISLKLNTFSLHIPTDTYTSRRFSNPTFSEISESRSRIYFILLFYYFILFYLFSPCMISISINIRVSFTLKSNGFLFAILYNVHGCSMVHETRCCRVI